MLSHLKQIDSVPKVINILWNESLEKCSKAINTMVSDETLLNYTYWKIPFTIRNYASDKQLGDVIIQNNKPIDFSLE